MVLTKLKACFRNINARFREVSLDSLMWIVNIIPYLSGFSIRKDKIGAPFWILHIFLLAYVYGVGTIVYNWKFALVVGDYVKSCINISLIILIANISWWFMSKRSQLLEVLKKIALSDELAQQTDTSRKEYKNLLKLIKRIVIAFFAFNYFDEWFIYLPHRAAILNDYSMTPCVGLEPITSSPNREICTVIICLQEWTNSTIVLSYQALLLLVIAHTALMYRILSFEMMEFNNYENLAEHQVFVKKILPSLVERHSLILSVIDKLKSLYSLSLGINFSSHAACMMLVLYLPLREWFMFIPVTVYCFSVFFLYCFLCQKLVNASEDFESSVYCCGWENFGGKEKKMIYVMLCQAQKPVEILAADIIPINIYIFATTLQAMFKFVTVVKL